MLVLGLDLETTGLDVASCEIIEVGAVLWDWTRGAPLRMLSELVHVDCELPADIVRITGIENQDVQRWGLPLNQVLERLKELAEPADYIVAHNGMDFDKLFLERAWLDYPKARLKQEWIDTLRDLPLPTHIQTRKLAYLAAEHGFLNPFLHRSLFDVLSMLKVLNHYSAEDVLKLQRSPWRRLVAKVSFEEKDLAKNAGFRWDPQQRHWYLEGKECVLSDRMFAFPTEIL